MSKRKAKEKQDTQDHEHEPKSIQLKQETKHTILSIVFFVLGLFFTAAMFGMADVAGDKMYKIFSKIFGVGYFLLPLVLFFLGISFFKLKKPNVGISHTVSALTFLFSSLGIIFIVTGQEKAGYFGYVLGWPAQEFFGIYFGIVLLFAFDLIALLVLFDRRPSISGMRNWFLSLFGKKQNTEEISEYKEEYSQPETPEPEEEYIEPTPRKESFKKETIEEDQESPIRAFAPLGEYKTPPLSLLEKDRGKVSVGDTKANSVLIKRTLQNFGIPVEMDEITIGPTVTRYALKPAQGVRLSRITALQNEIALALAAPSVRIEAPIPGKSLVGIEIPNQTKSTLGLGTLLEDKGFAGNPKSLTVALGKDIAGKPSFYSIAKMPHLLIAGTTGSGKSVTVHTLITSLLYRHGPEQLRFIMVDPKRVELTLYNSIPHLLTPVITEPKKAILSLKWAVKEMERRYDFLQAQTVRDISSYHEKRRDMIEEYGEDAEETKELETMPYIVVIIDELADIMSTYPRELEAGIVRLAQMSRAVGIHLILSTQRPDSNVITGLIKANIPARIALKVSSQINSRIIIDDAGAEKLLGAGDMLFSSGEKAPERLQCPFVTEKEVKEVVKFIKNNSDILPDEINLSSNENLSGIGSNSIFGQSIDDGGSDDDDDLYEEARQVVIESRKASTSFLQRKLKIGYSRAARIMDMLEDRGVISSQNGAKGREVLEESPHGGSSHDYSEDDTNEYPPEQRF
jgi:S-DNA-T family DNA segregation ATPase FtsK/SpoIIIE